MSDAPTPNRQTLENLFCNGSIDLVPGRLFDRDPDSMPDDFDFDRVEGMMLGLVIGEALGMPTERWLPNRRRLTSGEIRDYPQGSQAGAPVELISDDMYLAFSTLEQMIADGGFNPQRLAECFCHRHVFGRGFTVRQFISNYRSGLPWYQCGPKSSRNGAIVRIAPILIPHLPLATSDLWVDTALAAMITHNDAGSTAACLAWVNLLWSLLRMRAVPEPMWWLSTFCDVMREVEGAACYRVRSGKFFGYEGTIGQFLERHVAEAYDQGLSALDACNQWHSGVQMIETAPSVVYLLMRYGHDPEEAIVRAVNDTKDNDTIAAMVGAAVGALHGRAGLPARWIERLPLGSRQGDGTAAETIFELLAAARQRWGSPCRVE